MTTATQVGLLPTPGITDLPSALLPDDAPAACKHFLRRWLLLPPRPSVADAARAACVELTELRTTGLPSARPVPVGKLVGLILAKQANAATFLELKQLLSAMHRALDAQSLDKYNDALLKVVKEEAGLSVERSHLSETARSASERIAHLVAEPNAAESDTPSTDPYKIIPNTFFSRNEPFRAMVQPSVLQAEYTALEEAAAALCEAVAADVEASGATLVHDINNNALHLRVPKAGTKAATAAANLKTEPAKDRNNRLLPNRDVTRRMRERTLAYRAACADLQKAVVRGLQNLCEELHPEMPTVVTAAHYALLSTTLSKHVEHSLEKGWSVPDLKPVVAPSSTVYNLASGSTSERALELEGVWPYWLPRQLATRNDVNWDGLWLLTAPNMAGKSSLMRSMLTSALLANSGLLAPVSSANVPRYDAYFLRTASFDAPAEGKSAFAQEMDDLHVMAAECTPNSLVMLDEIGRGTSTHEGSALCAAILEWLDERRIGAIFATHLHEIDGRLIQLGRPLQSLVRKCLPAVSDTTTGALKMSFTLADGVCKTSYALHAATRAKLPAEIIARAEELLAADDNDGVNAAAPLVDVEAAAADARALLSDNNYDDDDDAAAQQLAAASEVLKSLSGQSELVRISSGWVPPPRLRGRSCVYVLQRGGGSLYVGESDSIGRRLKEHRSVCDGGEVGECLLVEVGSKSEALQLEELTIRKLKEMEVALVRNVAHG